MQFIKVSKGISGHLYGKRGQISLISLVLLLIFSSCHKTDKVSNIPHITLNSVEILYQDSLRDSVILTIGYEDGDGDIGLREEETSAPYDTGSIYYFNLYADYFELQNGQFVRVNLWNPNLLLDYRWRIPRVNESGKARPIKGEIKVRYYFDETRTYPNFKYQIYLYDRALHQSNVIETPLLHR